MNRVMNTLQESFELRWVSLSFRQIWKISLSNLDDVFLRPNRDLINQLLGAIILLPGLAPELPGSLLRRRSSRAIQDYISCYDSSPQ
eukprot:SAG11_NODE_1145_length_5693_cov_23.401323_1_plen_87_part_00